MENGSADHDSESKMMESFGDCGDIMDMLFPSVPGSQTEKNGENEENNDDVANGNAAGDDRSYVTLTQRRHHKLGLASSLPLSVRIPHSKTHANKHWYSALNKVWGKKDPWAAFHLEDGTHEVALRHRYDPLKDKWTQDEVHVKMEAKSFNRGAMRQCYRLKKPPTYSKRSIDWKHAHNYVAKKYMEDVEREVYFEDVKLQMDAKLWADEYSRHNPPKKIDIFQMYVIEMKDREGSPLYHLEHFIEGDYVKYNSNSGFVEETHRFTPQAFSHFTFEQSGHKLIVVDIQGVGDLYTDPQIHTALGTDYGDGNLGTRGMALFFHSHVCNEICRGLGLSEFDLSADELKHMEAFNSTNSDSETHTSGGEEKVNCLTPSDKRDFHSFLRKRSQSMTAPPGALVLPTDMSDMIRSRTISENPSREEQWSPMSAGDIALSTGDIPLMTPDSGFASVTRKEEMERFFGAHDAKPSNVVMTASRDTAVRGENGCEVYDAALGQIHHDLAKYHELGRFSLAPTDVTLAPQVDWASAMFHEEHAAVLGVKEAGLTMAKIYLGIPRDILVDCSVELNEENINKGVDYMKIAAEAGDRAAIIYMAKAYHTGMGLGTKLSVSFGDAVELYQRALDTVDPDQAGEYDATMNDPSYELLTVMADLYLSGGKGLEKDPNRAGELYTEAADSAVAAMKGRLGNKLYMRAEEAWAECEE